MADNAPAFTPETLAAFQAFYAQQEALKSAPPKTDAEKSLAEVHADASAVAANASRAVDPGDHVSALWAVVNKLVPVIADLADKVEANAAALASKVGANFDANAAEVLKATD